MMDDDTRRAVHAALTRHRPVTVRAYLGAMRAAPYQVAERRRRFPAVLDWLDSVDAARGGRGWDRLELLDAAQEVRHYPRPEAPAPEVEPVTATVRLPDEGLVELMPPPGPVDPVELAARMTAMNLGFLERMLAMVLLHDRSGTRSALTAMVGQTREQASAVRALSQVWREHSAVAVESAEVRAQAEQAHAAAEAAMRAAVERAGGEGLDIKSLLESLPALMQAMPMLRSMLGGILPGGGATGGAP